ncbi:MAG: nucleotidyl transferase AbiEii/AbiGii toxin family protein [bacterium]|nr:nucleotidyl transferase AbiEii/AbiGii toxin family protein [bacterium]
MLPKQDFFRNYSEKNNLPMLDRNVLHEFLQSEILHSLSTSKYAKTVSFLGGTALRFAYNIKRFSEDLDFDLVEKKGFKLENLADDLGKNLEKKGYMVETKSKTTENIHIIYLKFSGVLAEFGIKLAKNEKEVIKFEIDFDPPKYIEAETVLIDSFEKRFPLFVNKLDTLYAQKLLAFFFRPYQKGRDFYDLIWFISQKNLEPNYKILQEKNIPVSNKKELIAAIQKRLTKLNLVEAANDVKRFLFDPREADWIKDLPEYLDSAL